LQKNEHDWKFLYDNVPSTLQKYHKEGYKIVIFTNQGGISKGKTDEKGWKRKVESIQQELNVPLQVFAAIESDYYRKPSIGMWELMINDYNKKQEVSMKDSKYVGDAAGRPKSGNKAKDFRDSDYKFALNVGIEFNTPEMFFLKMKKKHYQKLNLMLKNSGVIKNYLKEFLLVIKIQNLSQVKQK